MLELCIKKPVISAVIALVILILGIISYLTLPVRSFPVIPANQVTITTNYYGASPDVMQGFITQPFQNQLAGLEHVDYMESTNKQGVSTINLYFDLGTDLDKLLPQISDRIQSVTWQLPKGANTPEIKKVNPNSGIAGVVIWIGFTSDSMSIEAITAYIKQVVIPKLESLPGIYNVDPYGALDYQMSILLDPQKMAGYGVTASDVEIALSRSNVDSTAGKIRGKYINFNVNVSSNLSDPQYYNEIVIKKSKSGYVRIKDIGKAVLKHFNPSVIGTLKGKRALVIGVVPKVEANAIQVSEITRKTLEDMKVDFPPSLKYGVLLDRSVFSKMQIKEVRETILVAVIFVFIVIFVFLGSIRSLLVPVVTIPLSILGGAFVMKASGYSLNTLTMLAWVLAIGLVVDDAIVVVENIYRYIEEGLNSKEASILGLKEITPAIIAMTLVVAVNFIPIGFMPGFSGALFKEFAFTMAIVVLFSGFLALFVSPAMCAGILRPQNPRDLSVKIDKIMEKFRGKYQAVLEVVVSWRYAVLILFIIGVFAGFFIANKIPSDLVPEEADGVIVTAGFGPAGRNIDYTVKFANTLNQVYGAVKEGVAYGVFYGFGAPPAVNQVGSFIQLNSIKAEAAVMEKVQKVFSNISGMQVFAFPMPTLPGNQAQQPINFVLKTSGSYKHLYFALTKLLNESMKVPSIIQQRGILKLSTPQVSVEVNRSRAQALGVPVADINTTLSIMLGQPVINRFPLGGYSFEVVPLALKQFRDNPSDISSFYVRNSNGMMFPLSNVVDVLEKSSPNSLNEFQQMHSTTLVASVAPGHTLGEALEDLRNIVKSKLPKDIQVDYSFQSREYIQAKGVLMHAFIIAIIFIYFLLCLKYNHFIYPLSVMLSVPLCLVGAVYTLYLIGGTFNLYTKIGLIMLVGLISKHGILIVSFADEYIQKHAGDFKEAVLYAAGVRLRPILMTTAAMVLGSLPLVLFTGAGAGARHQIGWVIIGGMCFGTCLSLFVVPCAFVILNNRKFGAALAFIASIIGFVYSLIAIYHMYDSSLKVSAWVLGLLALISLLLSLYMLRQQKRKFFWSICLFFFVITLGLASHVDSFNVTILFCVAIFGLITDYFYRIRHMKA